MAVDSYSTGAYGQTKGGYPGIQIKVSAPDPRVPASLQPPQANLPYTMGNDGLGKALDDDLAAIHKSGEMADIMKSNGLDPSAANVGEPRLVN